MKWKQYFTQKVIDRGYSYYRSGLVGSLETQGEEYHAEVIGTVPYQVSVWKKANHQLGMSCICPHAQDGNKCKHMAALCMKLEDEIIEPDWKPVPA